MTTLSLLKRPSRLAGLALVAACAVGSARVQATEVHQLTSDFSRAEAGSLQFYNTGPVASTPSVWIGSYKLNNGDWVYCLSPLTESNVGTDYNFNKVSLSQFLTGGGYHSQFQLTNPNYQGLSPAYAEQSAATVLSRVVELYNHAYADTIGNASKSAAFAYALWEIEGEPGAYGTNGGGLRLSGTDSVALTYASTLFTDLSTHNWGSSLAFHAYNFSVYQADPISSSQSFLVVSENNQHAGINDFGAPIPEPSTGLLVAASGLAFLGSRRFARAKAAA